MSKPVHPATRVVGWKSQGRGAKRYEDPATGKAMTYAELRAHAKAMRRARQEIGVATFEC
jgi:hypothetical protein